MELDAWTSGPSPADAARRKRLTIGYVVGAVTVAAALSFVTYSAHGQVFEHEDTIDVDLAKAPVVVAEVEPEPEPKRKKKKKKKKRKKRRAAGPPPKEVPDNVPEEADGDNPYGGDMDDLFEGDGDGGGTEVAQVVKRKPTKKKRKVSANLPAMVSFESERGRSTRATPVSRQAPSWSKDAVALAHTEGTTSVILRCVVQIDGSVRRCKVVKGHPALNGAALAAAQGWRFRPGTFDGKPQAQWYTVPFRIRIRS